MKARGPVRCRDEISRVAARNTPDVGLAATASSAVSINHHNCNTFRTSRNVSTPRGTARDLILRHAQASTLDTHGRARMRPSTLSHVPASVFRVQSTDAAARNHRLAPRAPFRPGERVGYEAAVVPTVDDRRHGISDSRVSDANRASSLVLQRPGERSHRGVVVIIPRIHAATIRRRRRERSSALRRQSQTLNIAAVVRIETYYNIVQISNDW